MKRLSPTVKLSLFVATALLGWATAASGGQATRGQVATGQATGPLDCLTLDEPGALAALERVRPLFQGVEDRAVRIAGLRTLDEAPLWPLLGAERGELFDVEGAAALLARLEATGLFARVTPRLEGDTLVLAVEEHPRVERIELTGAHELQADELLEQLLRAPSPAWRSSPRSSSSWFDEDDEPSARRRCAPPEPPRAWLARLATGSAVDAGILSGGLTSAVDRLARHLLREGYVLASFRGSLSAGVLRIELDEGRPDRLILEGVHPSIRRDVARELMPPPGEPLSLAGLRAALTRARKRWPFLHADGRLRSDADDARVAVEEPLPGELEFHSLPPAPHGNKRADSVSRWLDEDDDDDFPALRIKDKRIIRKFIRGRAFELDGNTLRLKLRSDRTAVSADFVELLRHTQVTGFAPGLPIELRLWDPGDRAHLVLDGALGINSKRSGGQAVGPLFDRMAASERIDWLAGAKVEIPALALAELGAQIHALTDTPDRWRISRLDSYLDSMLFSRPEAEYERRAGVAAFATIHVGERFTFGGEYRLDRYGSLDAVKVPVLFNGDDQPYGNPAISDGLMGSVVARVELSSEPVDPRKTHNPWRATETSLFARKLDEPGLRTFATLEVANPALGGDFKFWKLVSDTTLLLDAGPHDTLLVRARVAGGSSLPLQKQEALGGWEALRGYGFKELRGDWSLLGTVEYTKRCFGLFADLGSVRQQGKFSDPNLGVGALFKVEDVRLEAAWRTDQRARLAPEWRLLFARTF